MKWPDDRFEALKGLIDQGLTATQIGDRLGVTRNAIIGKVHRGGLAFTNKQGPVKPRQKRLREPRRVAPPPRRPPGRTELPPENVDSEPVTFAELAPQHCRWPVADRYCGAQAVEGSSYCARHEWAAHHSVAP